MSIISIIVAIALVGLFLWAIGQLPLDATIAKILRVVVIVALVLWLLSAFGLMPNIAGIRIGR